MRRVESMALCFRFRRMMLDDAYVVSDNRTAEAQLGAADRRWQRIDWAASSTHEPPRLTVVSLV